jgi:hypothetical protein
MQIHITDQDLQKKPQTSAQICKKSAEVKICRNTLHISKDLQKMHNSSNISADLQKRG